MTLTIVGVDLSLNHTGIAYAGGSTEVLQPTGLRGVARHAAVRRQILEAIRGADIAVIEAPFQARLGGTELDLFMLHGVINAALFSNRIAIAHVAPATLKKYATGKGNATKEQMRAALLGQYQLGAPDDDNEVDAWWLRAAGHQHYGDPVATVPPEQAAALHNAIWPAVESLI